MARGILLWALKPDADRMQESLANVFALLALLYTGEPDPDPGPEPTPGRGHYPTQTDESGRIVVPEGTAPRSVSDSIKAYWPRSLWGDAARVSYYESSWSSTAELNTLWRGDGRCGVRYWYSDEVGWATTEQSIGIFQINRCAHGGSEDDWKDNDRNARKGYELYKDDGWRPWIVTARRLGLID